MNTKEITVPRRRIDTPGAVAGIWRMALFFAFAGTWFCLGEDTIVTDRPDFTESGYVVPVGHVQFESGFSWTRFMADQNEWDLPELLMRWSFLPRTELRIEMPNYIWQRGGIQNSGFGDSSIGAKFHLGPSDADWSIAALATVYMPTGSKEFTSDGYDTALKFVYYRSLSSNVGLAGQLATSWLTVDGVRQFFWSPSVSVGIGITEKWGTFIEYMADVPKDGTANHFIHHGYTYLVTPHAQFDVRIGGGLNKEAPDFYVGGGFSILF